MGCKWETGSFDRIDWPIVSKEEEFCKKPLLCNELRKRIDGNMPEWEHWEIDEPTSIEVSEIMTNRLSPEQTKTLEFANKTPAGMTYLGQMLTHEIVENSDDTKVRSKQTPALNLESIYFAEKDPKIGDAMDGPLFKMDASYLGIDHELTGFDLPRKRCGEALIPELRNDENLIIAQLHGVWLDLHNDSVKYLKQHAYFTGELIDDDEVFKRAKRFVTLIFQKIIVEEYLRYILHPRVYELYFVEKREFVYRHENADSFKLPLEFSHAIFRFGHSMVRQVYSLNNDNDEVLVGSIFNRVGPIEKENLIDWRRFFYFEESETLTQKASVTNLIIASGLKNIVDQAVNEDPDNVEIDPIRKEFADIGLLKFNSKLLDDIQINDLSTFHALGPKGWTEEVPSEARARAVKNIILRDLQASADVPSAGSLIHLLHKWRDQYLYQHLGVSGPEELIQEVSLSQSSSPSRHAPDIKGALGSDVIPLWIFSMHEATLYPYTDAKSSSGRATPQADKDRLGAITSVVIAEAISMSVRKASTNIYQKWDDGENSLSHKLGALADVYAGVCVEFEKLTMSDVLSKNIFKKFN